MVGPGGGGGCWAPIDGNNSTCLTVLSVRCTSFHHLRRRYVYTADFQTLRPKTARRSRHVMDRIGMADRPSAEDCPRHHPDPVGQRPAIHHQEPISERRTHVHPAQKTAGSLHPQTKERQESRLRVWLYVLASNLLMFNTWGIIGSFGSYQTYYATHVLQNESTSAIAWIGSIQAFALVSIGVMTGPVFDHGYLAHLVATGSTLILLGLFMLSLCSTYWQVFLSQGLAVGLGGGCLYVPSLALVTSSFEARRGLAVGLSTGGGAIGGVVYPIVFRNLIYPLGFAWTTRVLAFIALGVFVPALAIMLPAPRKLSKPRSLFDFSALTEIGFSFFAISLMFCFMGYWPPFFYLPKFAVARAHISEGEAFYLLSAINAFSWVGRVGSGALSDLKSVEPIYVMMASATGAAIALFAWIPIRTYSGALTFAAFFGLFTGVLTTLPMAIVPKLSPMEKIGTRLGMVWLGGALGIIVGAPTAGELSNVAQGVYLKGQVFAGIVMMAGAISMLVPWRIIRKAADAKSATTGSASTQSETPRKLQPE